MSDFHTIQFSVTSPTHLLATHVPCSFLKHEGQRQYGDVSKPQPLHCHFLPHLTHFFIVMSLDSLSLTTFQDNKQQKLIKLYQKTL